MLVRAGTGKEALVDTRWKERPVAMVTVGQPRLPADCEEKAQGRLVVRHRKSPMTLPNPPSQAAPELFPLWSRRK